MSPRSRPAELLRRARGWLLPATGLALAPKCLLCLAAWAGLAGALGGPEFCGGPAEPVAPGPWLLPALGAALAIVLLRRRA